MAQRRESTATGAETMVLPHIQPVPPPAAAGLVAGASAAAATTGLRLHLQAAVLIRQTTSAIMGLQTGVIRTRSALGEAMGPPATGAAARVVAAAGAAGRA